MHVRVCELVFVCVCVCVYMCELVCVCVYMYIYAKIYTDTRVNEHVYVYRNHTLYACV